MSAIPALARIFRGVCLRRDFGYSVGEMMRMLPCLLSLFVGAALAVPGPAAAAGANDPPGGRPAAAVSALNEEDAGGADTPLVYIIPIRENVMPPLTYVVRRGIKQAMDAGADAVVLDMHTDGGRVDVTEEIIRIIAQFEGTTATFVNTRAFSAGAFIAVATQNIFMAPQSVIGAAAPVMMAPGVGNMPEMPSTAEAKMTSAIRALVRTQAEKNGHNVEVVEAMIDKTKELKIGDEVLNEEGSILTLTDLQAARKHGDPPRPLLSAGTVKSLDEVLARLGLQDARRVVIVPTGAERVGFWINSISPILLMIGMVALYIEFRTPGFGIPGIVGIAAIGIYFLGGYIAALSGPGWILIFLLGLGLVALEWFVYPGTLVAGLTGAALIILALVMAMADIYPGGPIIPTMPQIQLPLRNLSLALVATIACVVVLGRFLSHTVFFRRLVSQSASGVVSVAAMERKLDTGIGRSGVALTPLNPGGRARFDEELLDVITRGELVEQGRAVRIVGHTGPNPVVEEVPKAPVPGQPA